MTFLSEGSKGWQPYSKILGFENLYLEDSFVLQISQGRNEIRFVMELVLTDAHPVYSAPRPGENYCYVDGEICFPRVLHIIEFKRYNVTSIDASGERDLGNIDRFVWRDNRYRLEGDWGILDLESGIPTVSLNRDAIVRPGTRG
jgi:hypothetical protein